MNTIAFVPHRRRVSAAATTALISVIALCWAVSTHAATPTKKKPTNEELVAEARRLGFKGEYFLTSNQDPICVPYTKNLNQFRKLDFDDCHPRLSPKFPDIVRPEWTEVPLDLEIAQKARLDWSGPNRTDKESAWNEWLTKTAKLRAAGQVKMWLTQADVNNDGVMDPIARVQYAHPASSLPLERRGCMYSHSGLWKLSRSDETLLDGRDHFYFARDSDILYFKPENRYYSVEWSETQEGSDGDLIGATRSVRVELALTTYGALDPVCYINWVPTGSYRPLTRKPSNQFHTNE